MIIQQFEYPFDPNGTLPSNLITDENHTISASAGLSYNFIVPRKAPFFGDSLIVRHPASGRVLDVGVDYVPSYLFEQQSNTSPHLMVYGGISLLTTEFEGSTLSIEYQTLGGQYTLDEQQVLSILANAHIDPRITSWESVSFKPGEYHPDAHLHHISNTVGWDQVVEVLRLIADKVTVGQNSVMTALQAHIADTDNPHRVTLAKLGYIIATVDDLINGATDPEKTLVSAGSFTQAITIINNETRNEVTQIINNIIQDGGVSLEDLGLSIANLNDVLNGDDATKLLNVPTFKQSLAELAASTQYRRVANAERLKDNDRFVPGNEAAAVTLILPQSPKPFSFVRWIASDSAFSLRPMTIETDDKPIAGSMDPVVVSQDGICGGFIYMPNTDQWIPVMEGYTSFMPSTGWGEGSPTPPDGGSGGTGGGTTVYRLAANGITLRNNDKFIPDNSNAEAVYQLPANPTTYSFVSWLASGTRFSVNKMTINPNGKTIAGSTNGVEVTQDGFCGGFVFMPELDTWLPVYNGSLAHSASSGNTGMPGSGGAGTTRRMILETSSNLTLGGSYHLKSDDDFTVTGLDASLIGETISITTSPYNTPTLKLPSGSSVKFVARDWTGTVSELSVVELDRVRETLLIWTGTNLELV